MLLIRLLSIFGFSAIAATDHGDLVAKAVSITTFDAASTMVELRTKSLLGITIESAPSLRHSSSLNGSQRLKRELRTAVAARLLSESYPWETMKTDCEADLRNAFKTATKDWLPYVLSPCKQTPIINTVHNINGLVNFWRTEMRARERFIPVANLIAQEIAMQNQRIAMLAEQVGAIGKCEPSSELKMAKCLSLDASVRETTILFIANSILMINALDALPDTQVLQPHQDIKKSLNDLQTSLVTSFQRQMAKPIHGVNP